ncbi:MAG: hypothetical protein M3209_02425 [Acidobacteriota bacterium]|nr:hypothetical protein [Acidobacteriota bacterium]
MRINKLHGFNFLLAALTTILSFTVFAAASTVSNANYARSSQIALEALSNKIKSDSGVKDISLKFEKVNQYNASKSAIGVKGNARYFINSEFVAPLTFDVKLDAAKLNVLHINYDFEDADDTIAIGSPVEENITQRLLKQIGNQFKTANVVISIDNLETLENQLKGTGEVRIGDFEWRRIEFDAMLNKKGVAAVKYKIQE